MKVKIAIAISLAIAVGVLFMALKAANAEEVEKTECHFRLVYEEEGESKESMNGFREVEILKFPCVFKKGEPTKMTFQKEIVLEWPDKNGAGAMFTIQKGTTLTIKD